MSINLRYKIICILFLIITSCSTTSYVEIEILEPAVLTIPKEINKITIVGFNLFPENDSIKINKKIKGKISIINDSLIIECLEEFKRVLTESPRFDNRDLVVYNIDSAGFELSNKRSNWDLFKYICDKTNTDALVVLKYIRFSNEVDYKIEYTSDKIHSYSERFKVIQVIPNALWQFYDKVNNRVIDEFFYSDTLVWDSYDNYEIRKFISSIDNVNSETARIVGENYATRLTPFWLPVDRMYFIGGNEEMKRLKELAKQNMWVEMAKICKKYISHSNKNLSSKAAYNMAFICEMEGKLDLAYNWLLKAHNIAKSYYFKKQVKEYMEIIELRIKDQLLLNKQL